MLTLAVVVCALFGAPAALGADDRPSPLSADVSQGPNKPNIVMIYLDDLNPMDGRLWNDPAITPTLYDTFVAHGVQFNNAVAETPLCCPARAGLLTGLHTHNHGVTYNDIRLFNPSEHIGKAMKRAGYESMLIGKYFNHPNYLTAAQWTTSAAGWSQLDAIRTASDPQYRYFYNYRLFTKQGDVTYTDKHSTQMIQERAIAHFQATDASKPIFALLTPYDTHFPNLPMPEFVGDPRCANMAPWNPPSFNEADVSDKPSYIRNRGLLPYTDGWPTVKYCEEMLGIDSMLAALKSELQTEGRLSNTLFVFAADNGMGWGEHRSGVEKQTPYATRIPLYMSWPARWGSDPRTISDAVSNIDIAPTFCAVGGCTLGPYGTGQSKPDGVSLLALLDGEVEQLQRDAVLESNFQKRPFTAVRTSSSSPLGLWHWVQYKNGERELYDALNDPWELVNRATDPSLSDVRSALSARLAQLNAEGRVAQSPQRPDGTVAVASIGVFKGLNLYATVPTDGQTLLQKQIAKFSTTDFVARVTNHGTSAATYSVKGTSSGNSSMSIQFLANGVDVTSQIVAGSYSIGSLASNANFDVTVRVTSNGAPLRAKRSSVVTFEIPDSPTQVDVIKLIAMRTKPPSPPAAEPLSAPTQVIDLSPPP